MSLNNLQQIDIINFLNANTKNRTSSHNLLNESVQTGLSDFVLDKMFALTVGKYSKIDFSDIERSRGDITKIKYYANLRECIDILLDIHSNTDKLPGVLPVSTALSNMLMLKPAFEHGFRVKNNVCIMIYNTFMYAIMEATSYLIATSIDFVKTGTDDEFTVNVYSDSKNSMMIEQLVKFNKTVDDGTLVKFMSESQKASDTLQESGVFDAFIRKGIDVAKDIYGKNPKAIKTAAIATISVAGVLWIGSMIVPLIRETIYWIYKTRQKISDAAQMQVEFLEANIEILKKQEGNKKTDKIISRQEKAIKKFKAIARTFSIESDKAQRDAKKEIIDDKVDVSDVVI